MLMLARPPESVDDLLELDIDERNLRGGRLCEKGCIEQRRVLHEVIVPRRNLDEPGFGIVAAQDGGLREQMFAKQLLKRIDAETSDYYVLGYYSTNPDPTKRTRTLDVNVNRPDVSIASRRAYSLKTAEPLPPPPPLKPKK